MWPVKKVLKIERNDVLKDHHEHKAKGAIKENVEGGTNVAVKELSNQTNF